MVSAETLGNSPWPISEPLLLGTEHKLMTIKTEEVAVGPSVSLSRRVASKKVTMRGVDRRCKHIPAWCSQEQQLAPLGRDMWES